MSETLYITSNRHREVYHADRDCRHLTQVDSVYAKDRDIIERMHGLRECRECCGDSESPAVAADGGDDEPQFVGREIVACEYCGRKYDRTDEDPAEHRVGCVRRRRLEVRERHGGEGL